ncbi:RNA-binding protein [Quillaja saponaria]|uniref:RNA-binding protein n=1 Tax=Quillaja saponaria TaxID=32244 RepID=A0AAD7KT12_QUISA|nr:RNA-binding protein [Quillaja saponaria]
MEGIIPMVYKAIKKDNIRRKYRCLSTGVAQSYNIDDFYHEYHLTPSSQMVNDFHEERNGDHRPFKSVEDYGFRSSTPQKNQGGVSGSPNSKQILRFGSRKMFSCVSGD